MWKYLQNLSILGEIKIFKIFFLADTVSADRCSVLLTNVEFF